jgi:hypothetical protein
MALLGKQQEKGKQDRIADLDQALNVVRKEVKRGCSAAASPRPTLDGLVKSFAAFLRQIAPITPVLPALPTYKSFAALFPSSSILKTFCKCTILSSAWPIAFFVQQRSVLARQPTLCALTDE